MPLLQPPVLARAGALSAVAALAGLAALRPSPTAESMRVSESAPPPAAHALGVEDAFEQRVGAWFEQRCGECHGAAARRPKGGLRLTSRAAVLEGGESGPALDLATPDESLILRAVGRRELGLEMPPDAPLPQAEIDALRAWVIAGAPWPEATIDPEQARHFEERVRPVLAERCFACHGPTRDTVEGALRMAGREGLLAGGLHGAAIDLAEPSESLLLRAIRYEDRHVRMPPDGKLPDDVIADIERWVGWGAPWPAYDGPPLSAFEAEHGIDVAAARARWPFTPLRRPAPPRSAASDDDVPFDGASAIDAFVDERLARAGLTPNGEAPWPMLVRRLHVDLLGIPPTYEQLQRWVADQGADRYERLVDELLARPEYAEHWARAWLDLVRFAETNGYERDTPKPFAWRYREYVVDSFHADKPYDRFLIEQLAGDELDEVTEETLVATGFLRVGAWDDEPDDAQQAVHDERDDVVRTVSEAVLGLTVGCARCHDHLFDPITQVDYYRTTAVFAGLAPFEVPKYRPGSAVLRLVDEGPAVVEAWDAARTAELDRVQERLDRLNRLMRQRPNLDPKTIEERPQFLHLESLALQEQYQGDYPWILAAREVGPEPPPTHVLLRGRYATPGDEVTPGRLAVLCPSDAETAVVAEPRGDASSGRRLAYARWLTSPDHPLTARVMANRVWQHLFRVGLVATPNDFGTQGSGATHPELLDWLASEFVEGGWSLKRLQRTILLSRAYRRSSDAANALANEVDPGNDLLWRQRLRRLTAEGVHDAMLQASGELRSGRPPRGHYFPDLGREVLGTMSRPGGGWGRSDEAEQGHRALWAYAMRGVTPALASVLDAPNPSLPIGLRPTTTTATQALVLLNGEFTARRAAALAEAATALVHAPDDADTEVRFVFRRVLGRDPSGGELALLRDYVAEQARSFAGLPPALHVRPALPGRVAYDLLELLGDEDALHAPRRWDVRLGRWGDEYNGTLAPDAEHGPIALAPVEPAPYDRVRATLRLDAGCEQAGIVLRARAEEDEVYGVEVRLLPEQQLARVVFRRPRGSAAVREAEVALPFGVPIELELALDERGLSVAFGGVAVPGLSAPIDRPFAPGGLGVLVRGEGVAFDELELGLGGETVRIEGDRIDDPHAAALESLVQLLFNTNEFVYVD